MVFALVSAPSGVVRRQLRVAEQRRRKGPLARAAPRASRPCAAFAWSDAQNDGALGVALLPFGMAAASATLEAFVSGGAQHSVVGFLSSALAPSLPLGLGTLVVSVCLLELRAIEKALQTTPILRALLSAAAVAGFFVLLIVQRPLLFSTLAHKAVAPLLQPSVGLALSVAAVAVAAIEAPALGALVARIAPGLLDALLYAVLALVVVKTALGPGAAALAKYRAQAEAKQRAAAAAAAAVVAHSHSAVEAVAPVAQVAAAFDAAAPTGSAVHAATVTAAH